MQNHAHPHTQYEEYKVVKLCKAIVLSVKRGSISKGVSRSGI